MRTTKVCFYVFFDSIVLKGNPKNANSKPSSFETHSKEKISKMKKIVKTVNKHSAEDDLKKSY